ncbi:hypothetical protein GM3708_1764 [Geminocystis sp. NIES-3708]|uniref:Rho termination factor N-terminal domain-containing protein n=1 Tax=Geminocystis sp. NIES-3708 TaxID=1615909 RepID=UPI0005FC52F6|nr:Rho termination factor N-terminal domain-containing protein [Geminocystis sp. NIES-3708]BAQ61358.1 hypothetical protein GM3708_1764 [Geminocystis sp. NIES-3708]
MNYPQEMGNLISLYVDEIEINNPCDLPQFLIKASAKILNQQGGINWIPVIVKQIGESQYEVIGNSFIFAIALEAGLERVWCIVADDSDQTTELSQILAQEKIPKINLSKASRDEIKSALEYLIEKPDSVLKTVKLAIATTKIEESPRQYWQNFDEIIKLKCGITKGKKLDSLKEVFYLTPECLPKTETTTIIKPDNINEVQSLENETLKNLKIIAKEKGIKGFSKMKKGDLINVLVTK